MYALIKEVSKNDEIRDEAGTQKITKGALMKKRFLQMMPFLALTFLMTIPARDIGCATRGDYTSDNSVLYFAPDVTETQKITETSIYERLPEGIRNALQKLGYRYIVINENNDKTNSGHTGTTHFEWTKGCSDYKNCWSEGRMQTDIRLNGDVMNHEIGHMVASMYLGSGAATDDAASSEEWKGLYARYKDTIAGFGGLSKYEVYNAQEAFAESYAHVMNNRAMIEKKAPEIAAYVDKVNTDVASRYGTIQETTDSGFNAKVYYDRYPDLQEAFGYDEAKLYEHWISFGIKEGRTAS